MRWYQRFFRRGRTERRLDAELRFHLDQRAAELAAAGASPGEARRRARLEFGGLDQVKEACRDVGAARFVDTLLQDLRYGLRQLRRNPGFAAVAILTLALGIGATTAIFSLVNAVMLRPLAVKNPQRLVVLQWSANRWPKHYDESGYGDCQSTATAAGGCSFSFPVYQALRRERRVFSGVFASAGGPVVDVAVRGRASLASTRSVSPAFFTTLGLRPAVGRFLTASDNRVGAAPTAVITYGYWQQRFGGSRAVVGRSVTVNGAPTTIVGVAPRGFEGMDPGVEWDLLLPLARERATPRHAAERRTDFWLTVVARLAPGVSRAQAQAAASAAFLASVTGGAKPPYTRADAPHVRLLSAANGFAGLRGFLGPPLLLLLAAVGILLLTACANVASLLLARAAGREREIAVRFALGAGRARIARQLLTESAWIAAAGVVLGLGLAYAGAQALAAFVAENLAGIVQLKLHAAPDLRVLGFAVGVAVVTALLFGLAPAVQARHARLGMAMKSGEAGLAGSGRRWLNLGNGLVVAQVALAILALAGAGLLVRTVANLEAENVGFNTRNLLLFGISPKLDGYKGARLARLFPALREKLAALPGVISVSYASDMLLAHDSWRTGIELPGQRKEAGASNALAVGSGFFRTMGIPWLAGRRFTARELGTAAGAVGTGAGEVAVVNAAFARRFFRGRSPLGRVFNVNRETHRGTEIIGEVAETKYSSLRQPDGPTLYYPFAPNGAGGGYFVLRTAVAPAALIADVRRVVAKMDPTLPVFGMRTQRQVMRRTIFAQRLVAWLSSLFGALALVLAAVGLYGLMAYETARRTREIGLRMALGADRSDLVWGVIGRGLGLAAAGAMVGAVAAVAVTQFLRSMLFGVRPGDPATLAAVAALLAAVMVAACYVPARRAAKVDPMVALRSE
ncbi:MAG: ADOP family duplicated permease [Terriglobales bacterium]